MSHAPDTAAYLCHSGALICTACHDAYGFDGETISGPMTGAMLDPSLTCELCDVYLIAEPAPEDLHAPDGLAVGARVTVGGHGATVRELLPDGTASVERDDGVQS